MGRTMILYRGVLKSCNYQCSYCPFSKHRISKEELEKDKEQWQRFVSSLLEKAGSLDIGAMMVVPYGEALIHPWYWKGLAQLTASPDLDAAGAQTNFSFSVEKTLEMFDRAGGRRDKLRLWASFHPGMIAVEEFAGKCRKIWENGISICAGAVGVTENLLILKELREALPEDIYLWINKEDGRRKPYSKEEQEAFSEIDPFFCRELAVVPADASRCAGRFFVEGDGTLRSCNISPALPVNWYDVQRSDQLPFPGCSRKRCSCYLAYGGRENVMNHILFGPYPLFRIPRRPRAVFLDIDKTLIPDGMQEVPDETVRELQALQQNQKTCLFFATSLPYDKAMERCRKIRPLFSGGIFAAGAHLILEYPAEGASNTFCRILETEEGQGNHNAGQKKREQYVSFDGDRSGLLKSLEEEKGRFHFRILSYRGKEGLYKLTLARSVHMPWKPEEAKALFDRLPEKGKEKIRYFIEDSCLQVVASEADKANGVRVICNWLGIRPEEAAAAGDSPEDEKMVRYTCQK